MPLSALDPTTSRSTIFDQRGRLARSLSVRGLPTTFLGRASASPATSRNTTPIHPYNGNPGWNLKTAAPHFVVEDANGQTVAYRYFRKDENEAPLHVGNTLPLS